MLYQIKSYLQFLKKSTSQHGVHSPFVFDLVTKCFYDKKIYPEYQILKNYRNALLQNHETIEVTDFGAGSRVFKSNKRKVADIAKTAGISPKSAQLLFRLVQYFKPGNILELGTSLGLATCAMVSAKPRMSIFSLEGCEATAGVAIKTLRDFGFEKKEVYISVAPFEEHLARITVGFQKQKFWPVYDMIYFDGNHQKDATLQYFDALLPTATNDSVWIFDDIHWSAEMEQAWEIIKKNPKVTVTIDTFQWGLVFFRQEQEKEHFTIRI